jgi:NAD(P)-dependent dehydrogenase (short-subunit alcohol dehydrogenase family)
MKPMSLKGKVVVVTGASAGVGRATVREFARRGALVGLIARGEHGLAAAVREVEIGGGRAHAAAADVADADAVEAAAASIEQALGPIDIWVNNAMATVLSPFADLEAGEFRRVTEVTYLGAVYGTMAALRRMRTRNRGTIVQVASALSARSIPLQSPYCGAKHAILGFTDSLRSELEHDHSGVRVSAVHLPAVNTPQFDWARNHMVRRPRPVAPIYQPEVAARAIVWAAQHERRELLVGASTLLAEWAQKFVPGLLDRYLARSGFRSQLSEMRDVPGRPDNLFTPVDIDPGAHGRFDADAHRSSVALWLSEHRAIAALAAVATVGSAAAWGLRGSSKAHRIVAARRRAVAALRPSALRKKLPW